MHLSNVGQTRNAIRCQLTMHLSNMGQTRNANAPEQRGPDKECDKVPADNAPEQHGSDKECNKVPADSSKNVSSDNEPHNANTTPVRSLQSLAVLLKLCRVLLLATVPLPLF